MEVNENVVNWILSNDVGASSLTLLACYLRKLSPDMVINYPHDPDDFGRCKRFLATLEQQDKKITLQRAAEKCPVWKALATQWEWLEAIIDNSVLYRQMQKIIMTNDNSKGGLE